MKRSSSSKRSILSRANTIVIACLQAQSLTKLRHPDLLQITEPLEETRSELTFVTEAITGSLSGILKDLSENVHGPGSDRNRGGSAGLEVDEVEVSQEDTGLGS
jgi:SCY1-like protein 2